VFGNHRFSNASRFYFLSMAGSWVNSQSSQASHVIARRRSHEKEKHIPDGVYFDIPFVRDGGMKECQPDRLEPGMLHGIFAQRAQ
jgi:hypothetical protein